MGRSQFRQGVDATEIQGDIDIRAGQKGGLDDRLHPVGGVFLERVLREAGVPDHLISGRQADQICAGIDLNVREVAEKEP